MIFSRKWKSHLELVEIVKAETGVELKPFPDTEQHNEWFMQEFEGFSRRQELERAILKAADMLEKGEYDPVEKLIKDAVQISLTKDMGTDYFADPRSRLEKLKNNNGQISTGWTSIDKKLYGGFNRGELNIFCAASGGGKSLFLANLGCNWAMNGLNVLYLTFELAENLVAMRMDSMMTNVPTREVFRNLDDIELKVKMLGKQAGSVQIKYMPSGKNCNDIRAYLKEVQIQTGIKVDFVMVDYLDLVMPVSVKVNPNDQFIKDKYVSEELRNLAKELGVLLVTASQLNRSAVEEIEFDHSHIAGGISKINTADNVFGIFTSRSMRERGKYQIQCMKSRSSTGVGQKIDLEYNIETMRITDPGEDGQDDGFTGSVRASNILDNIKTGSTVKPKVSLTEETPKVVVKKKTYEEVLKGNLTEDTNYKLVAIDKEVKPNNLYCLSASDVKLGSDVANFKLLATYHTPSEGLNTASFV